MGELFVLSITADAMRRDRVADAELGVKFLQAGVGGGCFERAIVFRGLQPGAESMFSKFVPPSLAPVIHELPDFDVWCDESGLAKELPLTFVRPWDGAPIVGPVLVTGKRWIVFPGDNFREPTAWGLPERGVGQVAELLQAWGCPPLELGI